MPNMLQLKKLKKPDIEYNQVLWKCSQRLTERERITLRVNTYVKKNVIWKL